MNNHSLIIFEMARIIDEGKIHRIREATIEFVVQNGYGGAAISSIARRAGVAEGYLYRFYSSKQELVTELLYSKVARIIEKLEFLLSSCGSIKEVINQLIGEFFKMAVDSPEEIKFIHVLMHDYNFPVQDVQRHHIKALCETVVQTGVTNGELNRDVTAEEAYGIVVIYPIEFINLRMKGFFGTTGWTLEDEKRVAEFAFNALKQSL
jgi:AcrR family transcriptional regulator